MKYNKNIIEKNTFYKYEKDLNNKSKYRNIKNYSIEKIKNIKEKVIKNSLKNSRNIFNTNNYTTRNLDNISYLNYYNSSYNKFLFNKKYSYRTTNGMENDKSLYFKNTTNRNQNLYNKIDFLKIKEKINSIENNIKYKNPYNTVVNNLLYLSDNELYRIRSLIDNKLENNNDIYKNHKIKESNFNNFSNNKINNDSSFEETDKSWLEIRKKIKYNENIKIGF